MRLVFENALLSISSRFAARSVDMYEKPVMLPPGRARLATTPSPTGSPLNAMTIGTVVVARFTAHTAGPKAMITSTLRRDQFCGKLRQPIWDAVGPKVGKSEVFPFCVSELAERITELTYADILRRCVVEDADSRHFGRLLRPCRNRPRRRCAAEQRDEDAPFHCSMPPVFSDRKDSTSQLRQEAAALRDFGLADDGFESKCEELALSICRPVCPR